MLALLAMQPSVARAQNIPIECHELDAEMREKLRGVLLTALDEALRDHVTNAFAVWMRDNTGQPARAAVGIRNGMRAYMRSRAFVLRWCPQQP